MVDNFFVADSLYRDAFDVAVARAANRFGAVRRASQCCNVRLCAILANSADYVPQSKILHQRLQNFAGGRTEHGQLSWNGFNGGGDVRSVRAIQNRSRAGRGRFPTCRRIQPQFVFRVGGNDCHADNGREILRGAS